MSLIEKVKTSDLLKGTTLDQQDLTMIFSTTKDGWNSETFHKKVDFNPPLPTVAICKTKSGMYFYMISKFYEFNKNKCNILLIIVTRCFMWCL